MLSKILLLKSESTLMVPHFLIVYNVISFVPSRMIKGNTSFYILRVASL